jgi:electron transfer flavoprotein beta subunit
MNRYDEYALEAALRLRETWGASRIDAVSVGARGADEVLRRAIGMGADHGVHIQQAHQVFPSPFAIGGVIAAYAQGIAYDLIFCGAMSEDMMQGQVGPVIAGLLHRPCLTAVHTLGCSTRTAKLRCAREVEGGRHEVYELELPALVSIQSGIHPPRYPALSKLLRANQYPLETIPATSQVALAERQRVCATRMPVKARRGILIEGTAEEKGRRLASVLRARGLC